MLLAYIQIIHLEEKTVRANLNQEEIMQLLDKLYKQSIHGVAKVSPTIDTLASDYLQKAETLIPLPNSLSTIKLLNVPHLGL